LIQELAEEQKAEQVEDEKSPVRSDAGEEEEVETEDEEVETEDTAEEVQEDEYPEV
jgi:hypothetical protein